LIPQLLDKLDEGTFVKVKIRTLFEHLGETQFILSLFSSLISVYGEVYSNKV